MDDVTDRLAERVHVDPAVHHGDACFAGTRIPVNLVLDYLSEGLSSAAIRDQYPTLPPDAAQVALSYAAQQLRVASQAAATG